MRFVDRRIEVCYLCKGKGYIKENGEKKTCPVCEGHVNLEVEVYESNGLFYTSSKPFGKDLIDADNINVDIILT